MPASDPNQWDAWADKMTRQDVLTGWAGMSGQTGWAGMSGQTGWAGMSGQTAYPQCVSLSLLLESAAKMPASDPNQWDAWADKMTRQEVKQEKRRIMKNILLISVGFLFNFTAFQVGVGGLNGCG